MSAHSKEGNVICNMPRNMPPKLRPIYGKGPGGAHRAERSASPTSGQLYVSPYAFQQARLTEQLRLSKIPLLQQQTVEEGLSPEHVPAAEVGDRSEEAHAMMATDGSAGEIPFAPMMTYPKYLTMQEKRVKVTIRYSADAGLRPFYLTLANKIKSAHPDVLLEKRILPTMNSDAGESSFEVTIDGKLVIDKKKTRLLKVVASTSRSTSAGGDEDKSEDQKESNQSSDAEPNIAGGRSIFVSMEKIEQEIIKARKRRRPNTFYKSKEDALRDARLPEQGKMQSPGISEAVLRLERLKAMSSARKSN
ncbi:hypothetical protein THAOC_14614 [Thalassiosira oceanica]|uniref:Uncharacterized protein n=1 Tax=Thalassiosira oceanica TaxID=159749 RepID=K0SUH7_THAOC|nr:hypothetical protein THAOC_14614 [Thalassiosira oceanica]|eukprot:EJK64631.1 hypothetical protein THAOC_14614 [Thalassiosira oceanica]